MTEKDSLWQVQEKVGRRTWEDASRKYYVKEYSALKASGIIFSQLNRPNLYSERWHACWQFSDIAWLTTAERSGVMLAIMALEHLMATGTTTCTRNRFRT